MAANVVLSALKHVWSLLGSLQIPQAVMGGLALAVWNHVRATRDVDLLVGLGQADVNQVLKKLSEAGIRAKGANPLVKIGNLRTLQLLYEPPGAFLDIPVDLLLADCDYQR